MTATLAVALLNGAARGGVYDLDDPAALHIPPLAYEHDKILLVLAPLRAAAVPVVPEQAPEQVKKLAAELEAQVAALEAQVTELQTKINEVQAKINELQAKIRELQAQLAELQAKNKELQTQLADLQTNLADAQSKLAAGRLKLGACYLRHGRPKDAAQVLAKADDNNYLVRLYRREAELESKAPGDWTTADRIGLSACYIRLNRPNEAIRILTDVNEADRGNFLVLANLAAAYQGINELGRAVEFEKQALAAWPSIYAGWNSLQLSWYRRTEGYNLKLLESRLRESRANPPNKAAVTLDPIFGEPRQAAADYDAFEQPWALWDDLPPDAYHIVAQLLVWSPNDDRLYWQLGEVLNTVSPGYVPEAAKIFDDLANRSLSGVKEFRQHRQALNDALPLANALALTYGSDTTRFVRDFHFFMLDISPPGLLLPPGIGDASNAVGAAATAEWYTKQAQQQQPPGPPPLATSPRGWQPEWQMIFVGFAAGVIVATLGALQWTEWRRRRHAAAPPPALPPPSQRTEPAVHDAGAFRTDAPTAPDRMEGAP